MTLSLSDIKRIASLSCLELTDAQADETLAKLNGIFSLVEQMKAIDTTGIEPLSYPVASLTAPFDEPSQLPEAGKSYTPLHRSEEMSLRLREDEVTESNQRDLYQQPAPATQDGLYLVPKVIE
ncbi:MAG: Asp-tRNA(Asn)/Glu-tRNA(Gln) amidotransferase subunit GatC [Herbaspirillum sp.]